MKTAVAYARYSSDNQRDESITAQLRAIREYAAKNGIEIVREYTDEARSATTDDRPGFQEMIRDLKNGLKVDLVLVHKLDRFARNRYDAAVYRREIQKAGARLVAVDQPLDDSPEAVLLESLLEGLAEYYSRNLAREVMKGLKENALKGLHTGGRPPLGYRLENGRLVIEPREAEAVRLIFQGVLDGKSYTAIQQELNAKGYRTREDRPFGKNSLSDILRNEKYTGVYVYNRTARKVAGKRNHHASKPPEEVIKIPGLIPAIITREEWDKVQEILNQRRKVRPRKRGETEYVLTGKLVCGVCGSAMVGNSKRNGKGTVYRYYECNKAQRTGECTNRPIGQKVLEQIVVQQIEEDILSNPEELAEQMAAYHAERGGYLKRKKMALKARLAACQEKIDKVIDRLIEIGREEELLRKLNELKAEREALQKEYAALPEEEPPVTKETALEYLNHVSEALKEAKSPAEYRAAIHRFIDRIVVGEKMIQIHFLADFGGGVWIKLVELEGFEPSTS